MALLESSKKMVQIGLPTPGTPPADDFDQISTPGRSQYQSVGLSTPVSPALQSFNATESCSSQGDHVLYPDFNKLSPHDKPLFGASSEQSPSPSPQTSFRSISAAAAQPKHKAISRDSRSFLRTIPEDVVGVVQIYNYDPVGYAQYIHEQNDRHRAMRRERASHEAEFASQKALPLPTVSSAPSRDPHTQQQLDLLNRAPRIKKGKPYSCPSMTGPIIGMPAGTPDGPPLEIGSARSLSPRPLREDRSQKRSRDVTSEEAVASQSSAKRRRNQVARVTPVEAAASQAHSSKRRRRHSSVDRGSPGMSGSPNQQSKGKTHTRAQASKRVDDDLKDSEWMKLPDYCPDTSSLDKLSTKKLRVSWGTSDPLDLSNDPDEKSMHPQELELAATLRFHCNQYLINKRRIFKQKVRCLQEGKAFNKTACQQCTAMDVNKASKLWAAFDEVGWFDEHWFQQYL